MGVQVDSCDAPERIVVRTRNSVYDLVVCDNEGDVLIRGGRLFPKYRRACLVGATDGGHTVRMLGIYEGLCLELFVDRHSVVTSTVLEISRTAARSRSQAGDQ
jgi:hypothetical protein